MPLDQLVPDAPPGVSLGSSIAAGGGTLSSDPNVYMAVWWYEYPA